MKDRKIQTIKLRTLYILLIVVSSLSAQVGIGTMEPKTVLDVNGNISLIEGPQLTLSNGNNNNLNLNGSGSTYSVYQVTGPTSSFYITGIVPIANADGQVIIIQNTTNQIMFLSHDSASSSAANRIFNASGKDLMVRGRYATISLQYNASQSRWITRSVKNQVETWYTPVLVIADGLSTTTTILSPGMTPTSGVAVNLVNNSGLPASEKYLLQVEYVEAQTGQLIFRINNKNPDTQMGPLYSAVAVQYAITIFN